MALWSSRPLQYVNPTQRNHQRSFFVPETCKAMGEGKEVIIHGQLLRFRKRVKQVQTRNAKYGKSWDGVRDPDTRNECKTGGSIKSETFESHIQDAELSVKT